MIRSKKVIPQRAYMRFCMVVLCAIGTLCRADADSNSPYNYTRRFGGSDGDFPTAVIVDQFAFGFTVIAGYTYSTNFPGARPRPGADPNDADIFVTRIGATGEIEWSVVIGGSSTDIPAAIMSDPFGHVWVAGRTVSTDFPTTNALQSTASGDSDAFVFRVGFDGRVDYSTYLGGSGHDAATAIAVITNTMEVVVVGTTASSGFPGGQTGEPASIDAFVMCLDVFGTNVTLATALRGSDFETPTAVAIDRFNDIYVAGWTRSIDFPVTQGAYRSEMSFGSDGEAFVTKLDRRTGSLSYSTFLGIRTTSPVVLDVDWGESAYIGGTEQSLFGGAQAPRAPGTPVPPPTVHWNFESGFFARLTPSGSQLEIRRYDTSGRDGIRTVTWVDNFAAAALAGTLDQHPFTDLQPAPTSSTRPFETCGEESTHLFAFSRNGWFYHVSGLSPGIARPPGVPVPTALYEHRRRADILVQGYTQPPGRVSPVTGLSLLNTYEDRFSSNEVIHVRVDGGDVNGQLSSISVVSGANTIATLDTPPGLLALTNLPPGLYNLTAVALNTAGARGTSCPLAFTVSPAPANDSFYRAAHIEGTSYVTNATNEGASGEPTEPATSSLYYATARRSVWWCWEAPLSGPFAIEVTSNEISPQLGIFTGSSLSQLVPVALAGPGSNVVSAFKSTAGTHYFFSVDSAYSGDFLFRLRSANPPINDNHSNHSALTGSNFAIDGTNVDATREANVTSDYAESPSSVWWRWTAPTAGQYLVSVSSETFSPLLDVGSASNDFGSPGFPQPRHAFRAAPGEQFDFRVAGLNGGMGTFTLSVSNLSRPYNDSFSAATPLSGVPVSADGTTLGATVEAYEPASATGSVWYRWIALSNETVAVETDPRYSAMLNVYAGTSLSNLVAVGDDFANPVVFPAMAGREYYFVVRDHYGASSDFKLTVRAARSPTNDSFAAAIALVGDVVSVTGSNREATLEGGEPSHFEDSVWYSWVAPVSGPFTLSAEGSYLQFLVTPYIGSALTNLARATMASVAPEQNFSTRLNATAGIEYFLAVSGYAGSGGPFRLRIRPATPPPNDNFADRIELAGLTVHIINSLTDASVEPGEFLPDSFSDASAWCSWTAPQSRRIVAWLSEAFNYRLQVFTGTSLSSLTPVTGSSSWNQLVFDAQAGQRYSIQVSSRADDAATLNIEPVLQPSNDHFTNAFTLDGSSASATGIGLGATREPGELAHPYEDLGSVWWNWTAPASGRATLYFNASSGALIQQPVIVYAGNSVNSLTNVNLLPGGFRASTFLARAGETYHIAVYDGSVRPFEILLTAPAPPPSPQLESMRRLTNGSFEFQFDAITGQTNVIDASTDLINWTPVATNSLDCGVLTVLDPSAGSFPHRFYRLRVSEGRAPLSP